MLVAVFTLYDSLLQFVVRTHHLATSDNTTYSVSKKGAQYRRKLAISKNHVAQLSHTEIHVFFVQYSDNLYKSFQYQYEILVFPSPYNFCDDA